MDDIEFGIYEHIQDLNVQFLKTRALSIKPIDIENESIWQSLRRDERVKPTYWGDEASKSGPEYQQILSYVGILDAISASIYGDDYGNTERFNLLLKDYLKWEFADCVSIPHLYQLLRIHPLPNLEPVREKVFSLVDKSISSKTAMTAATDVDIGTVGTWFGGDVERKLKPTGLKLSDLTHSALFYRFRNRIVHSMRSFGFVHDGHFRTYKEPIYLTTIYNGQPIFQLIYSVSFCESLAEKALVMLPDYMKQWRIKELKRSKFDFYFYQSLNEQLPC